MALTQKELLAPVEEFLACQTPQAWLDEAAKPENLPLLLREHAQLEIMAGQSAMTMIRQTLNQCKPPQYRRDDHTAKTQAQQTKKALKQDRVNTIINKMSKLAREELRHFEQVLAIMKKRDIDYQVVSSSRYAKELHLQVRKTNDEKIIDSLIVGAFIEARSCERFAQIAPYLDAELEKFYLSLLKSESRHFKDYIHLAGHFCNEDVLNQRIAFFAELERRLIESDDEEFRFHSGVPKLS